MEWNYIDCSLQYMYQVLYNVLLLGSTFLNMDVEIFLVIHYHMEKKYHIDSLLLVFVTLVILLFRLLPSFLISAVGSLLSLLPSHPSHFVLYAYLRGSNMQ